jgi:hypothetical protein
MVVDDIQLKKILVCAAKCQRCASDCLVQRDSKIIMESIQLYIDCSNMCLKTAQLLRSNYKLGLQYLVLCEELCCLCDREGLKHPNIKSCQECAEECVICAEVCSQLIMQL